MSYVCTDEWNGEERKLNWVNEGKNEEKKAVRV